MPRMSPAEKTRRASVKRAAVNALVRTRMRTLIKGFLKAVKQSVAEGQKAFPSAQSYVMRAAKKGVIHKGKADRVISRMALKLKSSS